MFGTIKHSRQVSPLKLATSFTNPPEGISQTAHHYNKRLPLRLPVLCYFTNSHACRFDSYFAV